MAPSRKVRIVPPDPEWPNRFRDMSDKILFTIGTHSVEHVGSTSVPDLGAKPIIDIMVGVRDSEEADSIQKQLETLGYDDVTPQPGHEEWFYCLGAGTRELYYHVHLVVEGSSHWIKQLAFRDILRGDPEHARKYYELKKMLAERHGADRKAYTEAKTEFIIETLKVNGSS